MRRCQPARPVGCSVIRRGDEVCPSPAARAGTGNLGAGRPVPGGIPCTDSISASECSVSEARKRTMDSQPEPSIQVTENGPYLVTGGLEVRRADGAPLKTQARYALCRCGGSNNKPFCDGTHAKIGFEGTETADRGPMNRQDQYPGNGVTSPVTTEASVLMRGSAPGGLPAGVPAPAGTLDRGCPRLSSGCRRSGKKVPVRSAYGRRG